MLIETTLTSAKCAVLACDPDIHPGWALLLPAHTPLGWRVGHVSGGGNKPWLLASPKPLSEALASARTLAIQAGAQRLVMACEGQYGEVTDPSIELLTRCRHRIEACAELADRRIEFATVPPSSWQAHWLPKVPRKRAKLLAAYRAKGREICPWPPPWCEELQVLGPDPRKTRTRVLNDDCCAAIGIGAYVWATRNG